MNRLGLDFFNIKIIEQNGMSINVNENKIESRLFEFTFKLKLTFNTLNGNNKIK